MRRLIAVFTFLGLFGMACVANAQNLLFNGNLEASPAFTYHDGSNPSVADDVPGWLLFSEGDPSSWVQVALDGSGTYDVDLSGSETSGTDPDFIGLSGLQTAALSRPAVTGSTPYRASLTYDNYFTDAGLSYFIDWYNGGGILISSSGGTLGDPNGPFGYAPYTQQGQIRATSPALAASAGVRFQSSNGAFAGAAADNFFLGAVPEPGSAVLVAMAIGGLLATARRRLK